MAQDDCAILFERQLKKVARGRGASDECGQSDD